MIKINKICLLWLVFITTIGFFVLRTLVVLAGYNPDSNSFFFAMTRILPLMVLVLHADFTLGPKKTTIFIVTSAAIGLLFELVGVNFGVVFGTHYIYKQSLLMVGPIPLVIPLFWAAFIYLGYSITNLLLLFSGREKLSSKNSSFITILLAVFLDGLLVTSIDLLLDPIEVSRGAWQWIEGGPYFGIPLSNFLGWFIVSSLSSLLFRVYEYNNSSIFYSRDKIMTQLIPVAGFILLMISYIIDSLILKKPELAMIGLFISLPIVLSCFILLATKNNT